MTHTKKINIIAEIGINHGGEYDIANALIRAAAKSGASGIKFQYRNLDNAYADQANEIGDEMLLKEINKNYLSPKNIMLLVDSAHSMNIEAGISFFDKKDIEDFGEDINHFDFFKIPSVELNNSDLINHLLKYGKLVYVSLGCHNEQEIDRAFSSFESDNWMAMHCVSNYPVSLANAKIGYLKHMANKWHRKYGYSSHDESWEVCLIAMSMGASVIERHITFDKHADGLDHSTSSTPDEFRQMALFADNMNLLLSGDGPRAPNQGEMLNLQNLGRSYYTKESMASGDIISRDKLSFRSPRVGLSQTEMNQFIGKPVLKRIKAGSVVGRSAFEETSKVSDEAIEFARNNKVSIPVRLHDFDEIRSKFPIGGYEFHLSYGEVLSGLKVAQLSSNNLYSIHLPDYINPTQLMDPFSPDVTQAKNSKDILQRTVNFAKSLQDLTGENVPIVGSFSVVHENLSNFYEQHAILLSKYREQGVSIMPQWLPPIAWYFGGSVKLNTMNQVEDTTYIQKYKLPICMDVCHLCMGDSYFHFEATDLVETLLPFIHHVHIADAQGIDGEGLQFGEGDPKNLRAIKRVMDIDCLKVIEVWQGHLDGGAGFAKALMTLEELFSEKS